MAVTADRSRFAVQMSSTQNHSLLGRYRPVRRGSATPRHPHPGGLLVAGAIVNSSAKTILTARSLSYLGEFAVSRDLYFRHIPRPRRCCQCIPRRRLPSTIPSRCFVSLSSAARTAPPGPPFHVDLDEPRRLIHTAASNRPDAVTTPPGQASLRSCRRRQCR